MNERTNTGLIQQAYRSVQTGDISQLLNLLAEDVQWQLPEMPNVPFAGSWQGREGVGQFFRRLAEAQEVIEFQPEEFVAKEDKVIVFGRFTMRVKATGNMSRSEWAQVWTVQDGRISRMREYVDTLTVSRAHTLLRGKE